MATDAFLLTLEAPELAAAAQPGQFAMIGCGSGYDPFLRRPLSIHRIQRTAGAASFLYRVRGQGTEWLAARRQGEFVPLLGPLGRGFRYAGNGKKALLVGAGIGVAPLLFLAEALAALNWTLNILIGARTARGLLCRSALERYGRVLVITDDGSASRRGSVTALLQDALKKSSYSDIFACGPKPVLKAVQRASTDRGIPAQLSLEENMACGLGACMGCTCRGSDPSRMLRVCAEGPVFDADEVIFDD
ncbi:MAG: dihydroorotate dehydrogenase electron transfer subunit [Thermacetogeniaceae bacterium]